MTTALVIPKVHMLKVEVMEPLLYTIPGFRLHTVQSSILYLVFHAVPSLSSSRIPRPTDSDTGGHRNSHPETVWLFLSWEMLRQNNNG